MPTRVLTPGVGSSAAVDVVVVGAGQAGLSAGYFLRRSGLGFVVLGHNPGPGGAWQHRWPSLTLGTISAVQLLAEVSAVTSTTWVTRRPPRFHEGPFRTEDGRAAVAEVERRVRAALTPGSVATVTGLHPECGMIMAWLAHA